MIYKLIEAFSAVIILIPIFALLYKFRFRSAKRTAVYSLFAFYLAAVYHLVGLPTVQFLVFDVNLNLIPFVGMIDDLKNALLNVILFVPLGFFLPLLWQKYRRLKTTLLFGLGMTASIELLQLLTYRATDVNDIITNFAGTAIGYVIFCIVKNLSPAKALGAKQSRDLPVIFLSVAAVMFFVQPLIVSWIYKKI